MTTSDATVAPGAELGRLAIPGLIWGASFYFIAEGLKAFPAAMITPLRVGFGVATLTLVPAARVRLPRSAWPRLVLLAAIWMAVPLTMFPFAEERVDSSVAGMLNGAIPLFVASVATFVYKRRPSPAQLYGLGVGFLGVVAIALPTLGEGSSSAVGIGLIFVALACYGFALDLAAPLQQQYGSLPVLWNSQLVALVLVTPFAIPAADEVDFAWKPFLMIGALGVFGTALAYVVMAANAGRFGSTRASVTTYLIPVVSLILGAVILDESVAVLSVVGCAISLWGAWLAGRQR
ncbi:MAG: DMT family transporter [Actinobacteria bacterium]|nr:DMT family transporter [Actinomycetota bacterium]